MRSTVAALLVLSALLAPGLSVEAQTRATRGAGRTPPATRPPRPEAVVALFSVSTPSERWTLGDPEPRTIAFAGRQLTLEERKVTTSDTDAGERQYVFPVSWFASYASQHTALNYVSVRYRGGRAYQIVAEYLPERFVLPAEKFERHPDGQSLYANLDVLRVGERVFTKQALSRGKVDGKGGVWVDSIILQAVEPPDAK
jgi:hypothetical protein